MNLNAVRSKATKRLAELKAGTYSVPETEQYLRGMIAVLLCSDEHGATLLASSLSGELVELRAAQELAA